MGSEIAEPLCSVDRTTLLMYSPMLACYDSFDFMSQKEKVRERVDKLASFIWENYYMMFDEKFPQMNRSKLYRVHFRTVGGVDIQFGPLMPVRKKVGEVKKEVENEDGELIEVMENVYECFDPDYGVRIEWNPNKSDIRDAKDVLSVILKGVSHRYSAVDPASLLKVNRVDVAIDYPGKLFPELITASKMYKSFSASGSGGVESVYFGSRQSKNFFRIYDKARELRERQGQEFEGDLWRIELESKHPFFLRENPWFLKDTLARLKFFSVAEKTGDWTLDLILYKAQHFGLQAVLNELPHETKRRYKKVIESLSLKIEHPAEVFRCKFPAVWAAERAKIAEAFGIAV